MHLWSPLSAKCWALIPKDLREHFFSHHCNPACKTSWSAWWAVNWSDRHGVNPGLEEQLLPPPLRGTVTFHESSDTSQSYSLSSGLLISWHQAHPASRGIKMGTVTVDIPQYLGQVLKQGKIILKGKWWLVNQPIQLIAENCTLELHGLGTDENDWGADPAFPKVCLIQWKLGQLLCQRQHGFLFRNIFSLRISTQRNLVLIFPFWCNKRKAAGSRTPKHTSFGAERSLTYQPLGSIRIMPSDCFQIGFIISLQETSHISWYWMWQTEWRHFVKLTNFFFYWLAV